MNLAGIKTIIAQQNRLDELEKENAALRHRLAEMQARLERGESAGGRPRGEIVHVPRSTSVVLWDRQKRR